jgi:hypothetical protein
VKSWDHPLLETLTDQLSTLFKWEANIGGQQDLFHTALICHFTPKCRFTADRLTQILTRDVTICKLEQIENLHYAEHQQVLNALLHEVDLYIRETCDGFNVLGTVNVWQNLSDYDGAFV